MANTNQSKKRNRQAEAREAVNKARRSRIRTYVRKVEEAIVAGDSNETQTALQRAQVELARGVARGVLHKNTAARKVARLSARVKTMTPLS